MVNVIENFIVWVNETFTYVNVKAVGASVISFALAAAGEPDSAFDVLVVMMVVDFALGFSLAFRNNRLNSVKFKCGAGKFVFVWGTVALLVLVDKTIRTAVADFVPVPFKLHDFAIIYFCLQEFLSCAGHMHQYGFPMPAWIIEKLQGYRADIEAGKNPWDGRERRKAALYEQQSKNLRDIPKDQLGE